MSVIWKVSVTELSCQADGGPVYISQDDTCHSEAGIVKLAGLLSSVS